MALVSPTRTTDTTAQEPLLSYDLTTSPDPLKASPEKPEEPEERGELIIVGSRRSSTPADVEWIKVKVPAGTMSPDLATNLSSVNPWISLNRWTVRLDETAKEFVFSPAGSHETIGPDTGFTIQLSQIPISRKVGTAPIKVTEYSREGENGASHERTHEFSVGKFPADFYLRNLIVDPLVIDNGGETTLTWERSTNATYELLYADTNLNVTNETTRKITNIKSDTTFYLRGTTGDPTNPVTRILNTHLTVKKPDLEIGNLIVHGTVNGPLTVNGPIQANDTLTVTSLRPAHTSLIVNGTTELRGHTTLHKNLLVRPEGTLISSQGYIHRLEVGDSLKVDDIQPKYKEEIKLSDVKVDGTLTTRGALHAHSALRAYSTLDVHSRLTVSGRFEAYGPTAIVNLAGETHKLWESSPQDPQLQYVSSPVESSGIALAVMDVHDTGRNGELTLSIMDSTKRTTVWWEHRGSASTLLFVPKGERFAADGGNIQDSSLEQILKVYWISLGKP
ncbi:hypothetical protein ACFVJH_17615 [Streptomyces decoyicus]|uniref:hypothetical protein n=1 Tax=Streptomyces decoyicus TaxID=249567 RepID=UPI0036284C79